MKRTHVAVVAGLISVLLLGVEPVAAQSVNSDLISGLNARLLWIAVPIGLLVEIVLFYTIFRFRNNDEPQPTEENRRLEITWTIATAVILLFVGLASYAVLTSPYIALTTANAGGGAVSGNATGEAAVVDDSLPGALAPPEANATQIDVYAYQYGWQFTYPESNVTTRTNATIPADREVYFHLRSRELVHAFSVPGLGLKQDAYPTRYETIKTNATRTGSYRLYSSEYAGPGNSNMLGNITVMNQSNYRDWLAEQENGSSSTG